jgi:RNA polymerase sigma-70 factor, ECF subfamily
MTSYPTVLQDKTIRLSAEETADRAPLCAEVTDKQLVDAAIGGAEWAYEQLFDRHKRLVGGVVARYFRRQEEIEELVQVAFAKAFSELQRFRGDHDRSFASWLIRITANSCFDTLRKKRPETLHCDLSEGEADAIHRLSADTTLAAERDTLDRDLVDKLLSRLAPDDRALLHMLYSQEMSIAEVAETLGWSRPNVKIRAWRARNALRKIVGQYL